MSDAFSSSSHPLSSSNCNEAIIALSQASSFSVGDITPSVQLLSAGPSTWQVTDSASLETPSTHLAPFSNHQKRKLEEVEAMKETRARFRARLASDHALVLQPDADNPFMDIIDVVNRLLPYHVFQQPKGDLEVLIKSGKGKGKEIEQDFKREVEETRFALECHRRRYVLDERFRKIRIRSGKRAASDSQAVLLASLLLDVERAETTSLNNSLRTARAELERKEKEKRAAANSTRTAYYGPASGAMPTQYYRGYPYTYTQLYGAHTQPSTTTTYSVQPPAPLVNKNSTTAAIPIQLPVASLPALHALGIVPVPVISLPPNDQPQPPAVLRGSSSNGTMLSLEINVSLLQPTQMSGLATLLNSLMSRSNSASNASIEPAATEDKSRLGNWNVNTIATTITTTVPVRSMQNGEQTSSRAPSPTLWRRERLMHLGNKKTVDSIPERGTQDTPIESHSSDTSPTEQSFLRNSRPSYGTLPMMRNSSLDHSPRGRFPKLPPLSLRRTISNLSAPRSSGFRDLAFSRLSIERPISSYDFPHVQSKDSSEPNADSKINGVRVWYSSFSSVDWLHDAIKDSARFSRLRRHKSIRSRIRLAIDKSLGWFVVTIVGLLTAIVAFLVVRSEQWLFDAKEGYCHDSWWKAKQFCCPPFDGISAEPGFTGLSSPGTCKQWKMWAEVISCQRNSLSASLVEYTSYALIALCLAFVSSLLTIYLTKSTTFVTRKESGVFAHFINTNDVKDQSTSTPPERKVMYYAAGSGIPEIKTILSGFVIHGYLGSRVLFTKSVGLALSVASGLSLGKEGPFVHIASCIGNIISRFFSKYENNEAKRREILSAACAAGVAVAFGAPIGGTLFSLEEVSYFFPPKVMWRSFFCAMIAAITLRILDPFGTGKLVLFQVTYDKDWHAYELFPFVLLGIFGGIYGAYFSKLNYSWSKNIRNKTWLKSHPIAEVLLITIITTFLCFINPYTRMSGTQLVYELFAECKTSSAKRHSGLCTVDPRTFGGIWPVIRPVLVAMAVKAGLTIVTFGIKLPAGIFIPSLGVGACAGRVLGIVMQWLQYKDQGSKAFAAINGDMDYIIPGLYAMVGAAATLSGVTRTTVSLAVIMFELTDTLTYVVPVMLSVLVAKTVADALEPKGIYDLVIDLNQLPYLDAKHEYLWDNLQINDVTARDVEVIRLDRKNTVKSLRDQLLALAASGNSDSGFPILRKDIGDEGFRSIGYIGASELEHALSLVADEAEDEIHFHATYSHAAMAASSISSITEDEARRTQDVFDFSIYMDQAPLTAQSNSPLEMIHQFFAKLGARYVVITDTEGLYEGVIDKKTWLAFLANLEEK